MLEESLHFDVVADRYIKYILMSRDNDQTREIGYMEQWKGLFLNKNIKEIRRYDIAKARDAMLDYKNENSRGKGHVAVNRAMSRLKHFFNTCVYNWDILPSSPALGVKPFKENKKKVIFATIAQILTLLSECEKSQNKDMLLFAMMVLSSGARKSEVLRMKYEDLNYEDMSGTLIRQKNGNEGKIFFNKETMDLLKERNKSTGNIFKHKYLDKGFKMACTRAGIGHFSPHALRHTFASHFAMSGGTLLELQEALRVSSPNLVVRYAHLTRSEVYDKVRKVTNEWGVLHD